MTPLDRAAIEIADRLVARHRGQPIPPTLIDLRGYAPADIWEHVANELARRIATKETR